MIATLTKRPTPTKPLTKKWESLLRHIPGYDPFADSEGCWFDPVAAQAALDFFPECIQHVEGGLAKKPFVLELWQKAIVANLFGWKRLDSSGRECRRYRECLLYVPRKNGKTPFCAALALFVFFCDKESGSQCYVAAGEREQAGMLFRQAKGMVEQEPELLTRCKIYGGNASAGQSKSIVKEEDGSFLRVISADAETKHGGNTHLAIIDELHVQPNRDLVDVLRTSMASENRLQPLFIYLTTADFARKSICNEVHRRACQVRDGIISDPAFFPVIYEATKEDDWKLPSTWAKANPNLGISVSVDFMRRECQEAINNPAYENTFKRLHLNVQTEQDVRAIPMDKWDLCGTESIEEDDLHGRECLAGLDLSTTTDITAFVLLFRPEAEGSPWIVVPRFWVPGENAEARSKKDRVPYPQWMREGLITAHDGNRLDYGMIRKDINALSERFNIQKIAVDPWNATQLMLELQGDGFEMVQFRQGFASMTGPTKELLAMIGAGQISHGSNPVLRWMASNAATSEDPAGNLKFNKAKSTDRIDGIVALTMALGLAISTDINSGSSVYEREQRGFIEIG